MNHLSLILFTWGCGIGVSEMLELWDWLFIWLIILCYVPMHHDSWRSFQVFSLMFLHSFIVTFICKILYLTWYFCFLLLSPLRDAEWQWMKTYVDCRHLTALVNIDQHLPIFDVFHCWGRGGAFLVMVWLLFTFILVWRPYSSGQIWLNKYK